MAALAITEANNGNKQLTEGRILVGWSHRLKFNNKIKTMKRVNLKAAVWKEGKQYVSQCLNVDVASFGATKKKAMENLKEALELYFEDQDISQINKVERPDVFSLTLGNV